MGIGKHFHSRVEIYQSCVINALKQQNIFILQFHKLSSQPNFSEGTRAYPVRRAYPRWWTSIDAIAEEGSATVIDGAAPTLANVEGAAVAAPETLGSEGG